MPQAYNDMVSAIKKQIKKDNPDLTNAELEIKSSEIANSQWKKLNESASQKENSEIVVAENVKLNLSANIISSGEILNE